MIAWAGAERLALGLTDRLDTPPHARWPLTPLPQRPVPAPASRPQERRTGS
jgi:N6-L-threonylcarbamoyladenine synthase